MSTRSPPCNVVTPMRRETYDVLRPTYFGPDIETQDTHIHKITHFTVNEDETNSTSHYYISSSPKESKNIIFNRGPLKEFNYNIHPNITLTKNKETSFDRTFLAPSRDEGFDRDSLDSPNITTSPKPFYLIHQDASTSFEYNCKNSTFTSNNLNTSNFFQEVLNSTYKPEVDSTDKKTFCYVRKNETSEVGEQDSITSSAGLNSTYHKEPHTTTLKKSVYFIHHDTSEHFEESFTCPKSLNVIHNSSTVFNYTYNSQLSPTDKKTSFYTKENLPKESNIGSSDEFIYHKPDNKVKSEKNNETFDLKSKVGEFQSGN